MYVEQSKNFRNSNEKPIKKTNGFIFFQNIHLYILYISSYKQLIC